MSIKLLSAFIVVGLCCGYFGMQFWQNQNPRNPASEIGKSKIWGGEKLGKMGQAIHIAISTVSGVPDNDQQELRLKAEITLNQAIDGDLEYEWVLPEGVEIVAGEKKDALPNFKPGQMATLEISLLNISKEGLAKTVTLNVAGNQGSTRYGGSGSFATNSFVQMTAALAKERDSQIDESSVQKLATPKIKE